MLLSQAGIEGGRDGGARHIQALTEQGETLGETQGKPSLQIEGGRREKGNGVGGCGGTTEMEEGLVLDFQGPLSVLSSQVTVWKPHAAACWLREGYTWRYSQGRCPSETSFLHVIPPKTPSG